MNPDFLTAREMLWWQMWSRRMLEGRDGEKERGRDKPSKWGTREWEREEERLPAETAAILSADTLNSLHPLTGVQQGLQYQTICLCLSWCLNLNYDAYRQTHTHILLPLILIVFSLKILCSGYKHLSHSNTVPTKSMPILIWFDYTNVRHSGCRQPCLELRDATRRSLTKLNACILIWC